MKALSLWQPWASAIAVGAKRIETRSWETSYRGPLLIHAARTKVGMEALRMNAWMWRAVLAVSPSVSVETAFAELPFGAVLARCELVDCVPAGDTEAIRAVAQSIGERYSPYERELGNYRTGRWAWMLSKVEPLPAAVSTRGRQGLFEIDLAALERRQAERRGAADPLAGVE